MITLTKEQLKTLIEYRETVAQINELKRAFPFLTGDFYYSRLKQLQQQAALLNSKLTNTKEIKAEYKIEQYLASYK